MLEYTNTNETKTQSAHATAVTSMTLVAAMLVPSSALAAPTTPAKPVAENPAIEESDDAERTLRLHISVRLGRGDQAVEAEVRTQVTKTAQEAGFVVIGDEKKSPRLLYIVIERDPVDNATYVVKLAHYLDGVTALRRGAPFDCKSCDGEALVQRILVNVAPLLDQLNNKPLPLPKRIVEVTPAAPALEPQGPPRGLGIWGIGIALTAIGSGLFLGSGLGFIVTSVDKGFDSNRTAGWAMLGSGTAMLAAGIPLLVIGNKRMRRGRKTRASAGYNGRMVTVGLSGSF